MAGDPTAMLQVWLVSAIDNTSTGVVEVFLTLCKRKWKLM